jgi:hypothetical protein
MFRQALITKVILNVQTMYYINISTRIIFYKISVSELDVSLIICWRKTSSLRDEVDIIANL